MDSRITEFDPAPGIIDPLEGADTRRALDDLFTATYQELRRLAATVRHSDPFVTLSPTTLVNEAWFKLASSPPASLSSQLHFKRVAARAMRQVLVEAARRRHASRRGGDATFVTLDDGLDRTEAGARQILALNDSLDELARISPRQALMIEARFFGGLDIPETAQLLQVSEATVLRDWRTAKAWLARELRSA